MTLRLQNFDGVSKEVDIFHVLLLAFLLVELLGRFPLVNTNGHLALDADTLVQLERSGQGLLGLDGDHRRHFAGTVELPVTIGVDLDEGKTGLFDSGSYAENLASKGDGDHGYSLSGFTPI